MDCRGTEGSGVGGLWEEETALHGVFLCRKLLHLLRKTIKFAV
jgi:hypothetical protein